ncbi:hypothetical protein [Blastomonas sp.]|uniref:hypothetical protein n=1 Tax=Blastomonas sp. TaxID=1909299 RepID=UPI0035945BE7
MTVIRTLIAGLALTSLLTGPLLANEPSDDDIIVVTGERMTRKQAHELARAHAQAVLVAPVSDQNARWEDPLCIGAIGLREDLALAVIDRIQAIATEAKVRMGGAKCQPNVIVLFTPNSDAAFADIEKRKPELLSLTWNADRKKLRTPGLPVRWFYGQEVEGVGGRQTGPNATGLAGGGAAGGLFDLPVLSNSGASRAYTGVQLSLTGAIVLVDVPRVANVPLAALSDYIAFSVLSRTRIDAAPQSTSIMSLFSADEANRPDGLTEIDMALLKALYSVPSNHSATVHRRLMASEMIKTLTAGTP